MEKLKYEYSCYDCIWSTDKCKNNKSDQYNKFLSDITKCNLTGEVDNTLGSSWRNIGEDNI